MLYEFINHKEHKYKKNPNETLFMSSYGKLTGVLLI